MSWEGRFWFGESLNPSLLRAQATWQEHCYFIALHTRTLFGRPAILMRGASLAAQFCNPVSSPARESALAWV